MDKRRLYLFGGIILGGIAVVFLYIQDQKRQDQIRKLLEQRNLRKVVVAKKNVPKGTILTADVLGYTTIPQQKLEPGSTDYAEAVLGKLTIASFSRGQQIVFSKITDLLQTLSYKLPPGKRAITISVDKISSVNGMVTPGDFVDMIGTFPYPLSETGKKEAPAVVTLFQQVRILAVDNIISKEEMLVARDEENRTITPSLAFSTITFALTEEEAKLLMYALEIGKIRLLLRSSVDESKGPREVLTMERAYDKLFQIKKTPKPTTPQVEVFRGIERKVQNIE